MEFLVLTEEPKTTAANHKGTQTDPETKELTLSEAFFRAQWAHISQLAAIKGWYGEDGAAAAPLLDTAKFPLLASCVRKIFTIFGPGLVWECQAAVEADEFGDLNMAWVHGNLGGVSEDEKNAIAKRAGKFYFPKT